ncbi:hypothetical protein C7974DRAFT_424551 [Boeremia exigua]|uniref:uncharacterized protein n=1 Tax=Boeremia exigua TaxID=749465 RepID=UPI001E8E64AF|nr:uncharacterized protein C7974DRAFT_424551 [Boeremia exigua]KAH6629523.1 hypothetical protein C7974DRAFT_424551 [Boeremia exigua]
MVQPFRFLDLPKELRLKVYECLPVTTESLFLVASRPNKSMHLELATFQTALLATCKLINAEAEPYIKASMMAHQPTFNGTHTQLSRYLQDGEMSVAVIFICTHRDEAYNLSDQTQLSPPAFYLDVWMPESFADLVVDRLLRLCNYTTMHSQRTGCLLNVQSTGISVNSVPVNSSTCLTTFGMGDQLSFRFLELPKELRIIIYEQLPLTIITKTLTRHAPEQYIHGSGASKARDTGESMLSLHYAVPPVALLATCKRIRQEATGLMSKRLDEFQPCISIIQDERKFPPLNSPTEYCFIFVLALLSAAHKKYISLADAEELARYQKLVTTRQFDKYTVAEQIIWILYFARCYVRYASKHEGQPCIRVHWRNAHSLLPRVFKSVFEFWEIEFKMELEFENGCVIWSQQGAEPV